MIGKKLGWSAKGIGALVKMKVLDSYLLYALRKTLIKEGSILDLVDYVNNQIEKQKVVL